MGILDDYFGRKPEAPLYHYTSIEGLRGILSTGIIRATHIRYLTDRSEYIHGLELAQEILGALATSSREQAIARAASKHLKGMVFPEQVFVSSFCEQGDSLDLWRGYCPPFSGYCFGYDWRKHEGEDIILGCCIYSNSIKKSLLRELMKQVASTDPTQVFNYHLFKSTIPSGGSDEEIIGFALAFWTSWFSKLFKDPAFENEKEWRVFWRHGEKPPVKYRQGARMMIPYTEIPLAKGNDLYLERVTVGPMDSIDDVVMVTQKWIASLQTPAVRCDEVVPSKVPYRPI